MNATICCIKRRNLASSLSLLLLITILGSVFILYKPKNGPLQPDHYHVDYSQLEQEMRVESQRRILNDLTFAPVFEKHFKRFYNTSKHDSVTEVSGSGLHSLWLTADKYITKEQLFPEDDEAVDSILKALQTAPIVSVDVLDIGDYESGTADKWIVILEGGQKAVVKLVWGEKGEMKRGGLCNYGFEMPSSEIAAFKLHRLLGFRNTPYVTGRKINVKQEILPVASPAIVKQIQTGPEDEVCVIGKCYYCQSAHKLCSSDALLEASIAYWIPRHLHLYTWWPNYMPFSTPRMKEWSKFGFNNKSYCDKVKTEKPYDKELYYLDLFDFAVLDTLMYHFDSKHYLVEDKSMAEGLTVRLDHGRAFCAYDKDDEEIFLAPLRQCCTLRRSTFNQLSKYPIASVLSHKLKEQCDKDVIAPLLHTRWYHTLERRLKLIMSTVIDCGKANAGLDNVLV